MTTEVLPIKMMMGCACGIRDSANVEELSVFVVVGQGLVEVLGLGDDKRGRCDRGVWLGAHRDRVTMKVLG